MFHRGQQMTVLGTVTGRLKGGQPNLEEITREPDVYRERALALQAVGPDEYPYEYYRHLAKAQMIAESYGGDPSKVEAPPFVTKAVKDMWVECALQVRNFDRQGVAMSDCCRKHATSAVEMADGKKMWRCEEHRGVRRGAATGPVHETVQVRDDR